MPKGMMFLGVPKRAAEVRTAVNRLRWEIEYAADEQRAGRPMPYHRSVDMGSRDIAESLGILANVIPLLNETLANADTVFGVDKARFAELVQYYVTYHETPR